jgi:hypothetical protein
MPKNEDEVFYSNEVPMDSKSSEAYNDPWQQITNSKNNKSDYIDDPSYIKFRRSGRSKKGKSRRQLSKESQLKSKRNKTVALNVTVAPPPSRKPPISKELLQGRKQLPVAFDEIGNDISQVTNNDKALQEFDEIPRNNVSAVTLEPTENRILPLENKLNPQTNQEEAISTGSSNDGEEKCMEPYAFPQLESEDDDETERENRTTSLDEKNEKEAFRELNLKTETEKLSEGADMAYYEKRNSENSTKEAEVIEISNEEERTENWSDYMIEDTRVTEYDKEDVEGDEQEDNYDRMTDGRVDSEPTSEMKRIMDWFPRSKLLTTENNGYKLFPGVSTNGSHIRQSGYKK